MGEAHQQNKLNWIRKTVQFCRGNIRNSAAILSLYKIINMLKLSSLFVVHCSDRAVSHAFFSLCKHWQTSEIQCRMAVPSCEPLCRGSNLVEGVPPLLRKLYYRSASAPQQMAENRFLKDLKKFNAAYLWPGVSTETFKKVKKAGKPIFLERINCYTGKAKHILDQAYMKLGVQPQHSITPEEIKREQAEIEIADFILCPSPEVTKSFQEAGVPEGKLITTSYGWCPQKLSTASTTSPQKSTKEEITVLFLGSISVRKGAHILLRAWEKASIKGRLILFGSLEPVIVETCNKILARPDITHFGYSKDYASVYCEADIFAFPSLEEGSPLVTYEAMAHGLPILTSPMGSGGIVRDGIDGIIVSPYDEGALVKALQKLASSPELRANFGKSAYQRARDFTWEKTATKRATSILEKLRAC